MSQEADGSLWYSLLWSVWIYWIFRCWVEQLASITRKDPNKLAKEATIDAENAGILPARLDQSPRTASFFADTLAEIARRDSYFELAAFLKHAAAAYEEITLAFSAGDRVTLQRLVSAEVYESFLAAIREREILHEVEETCFVRVAPPVFESAVIIGDEAEITVRLTAELFKLRRDGAVVRSNPDGILQTADLWTFGKTLSSPGPIWTLVATAKPASVLTIDGEAYIR